MDDRRVKKVNRADDFDLRASMSDLANVKQTSFFFRHVLQKRELLNLILSR